jgi:hypothetical protein
MISPVHKIPPAPAAIALLLSPRVIPSARFPVMLFVPRFCSTLPFFF